jgi:hypothetical protein
LTELGERTKEMPTLRKNCPVACFDVLCWQKMCFAVMPILTPALLKGISLQLLREACDEVGVARFDAPLRKGFSDLRDQLKIEQTLESLRFLVG